MMNHLERLDLLLQKRFEMLSISEDKQSVSSPFYLLASDIEKELAVLSDFDFSSLDTLAEKLQLSDFEKDVLLIVFAVEIAPKYEKIYAYLQDDMNKKYPTVHFIADLLSNELIDKKEILSYFISDTKLSLLNLLEFVEIPNTYSKFQEALRIESSLKSFFLDNFHLNEEIKDFSGLEHLDVQIEDENVVLINTLKERVQEYQCYLFNVYGSSSQESIKKAREIAQSFGFSLLCVSSSQIPARLETRVLMKLLLTDALLSGSVLFFEDFEGFLEERKNDESVILKALVEFSWMSFFYTAKVWGPRNIPNGLNVITLENKLSSEILLKQEWTKALKAVDVEVDETLSSTLAQHFKFPLEKIEDVCKLLHAKNILGQNISHTDVLQMCRLRIEKNLEAYAQHLPSEHTLDDIILPSESMLQLREVVSHYKHQFTVFEKWNFKQHFQSRGLGVLFSGSSGTGKTMAASILANELGLELYRIELSKIVSKYIGETEKNLATIFEIAEQSGVVLFFDEADAIFGKRSEIKDSHDRYANLEVSYLLQRIEEYDGLVILASNFKNNIDEAFTRRMRFIIDFPLPNELQREIIWTKVFSEETDTKNIDFKYLAKNFKLSGANIRNAALYAAFNAVEKDELLNMDSVMNGIRRELHKIGKPLKDKEFELYKQE